VYADFRLWLALLVAASVGTAAWIAAFVYWWRLRRAAGWACAPGTIRCSMVTPSANVRGGKSLRVTYEFAVRGISLHGATPRRSGDMFFSDRQRERFARKFSPGQRVGVHYDPRDPTRNCLDRQDAGGIATLSVLWAGTISLGAFLAWSTFGA
jgi:hypothetical protein